MPIADRVRAAIDFCAARPVPAFSSGDAHLPGGARPLVTTGYWGRPGRRETLTKVHARLAGETNPLCGVRVHEQAQYQWCANQAVTSYIECRSCTKALPALDAAVVAATPRPTVISTLR